MNIAYICRRLDSIDNSDCIDEQLLFLPSFFEKTDKFSIKNKIFSFDFARL